MGAAALDLELKEPLFPPSSCNPLLCYSPKDPAEEAVVHEGLCCFLSFRGCVHVLES